MKVQFYMKPSIRKVGWWNPILGFSETLRNTVYQCVKERRCSETFFKSLRKALAM